MAEIHALKHRPLTKDMNFIRKLEQKQRQFEQRVPTPNIKNRRFKAHPNLLHSDSDTTASTSCTPRITTTFSASATTLIYAKPVTGMGKIGGGFRGETKLRAANFHRLLHEKLSIIDSNPSQQQTEYSAIGDSYRVTSARRTHHSDTTGSIGSYCSLDSYDGGDLLNDFRSRNVRAKKSTLESKNDSSAMSKLNSGITDERKMSNGSNRLSSQQSFIPKGIPVSVFERKVKAVVTKSLQNITDIKNIMAKGIEPPDGEEEEARRAVKGKEFSNRFSRNYLYPLGRQLQDFDSATISELDPLVINQKLLSVYQIIQTALQTYQHYLPTSHGDCTITQLKILMNHILGTCDTHRIQLKDQEENYLVEFVDSYRINAELVIQKLDEMLTLAQQKPDKKVEAVKSERSKLLSKSQRALTIKKPKVNKSKLSMYTTTASFRKDAAWKRAVDCLSKKRFNVKSKYRTAAYKHRPPMQKEPDSSVQAISRLRNLFPEKGAGGRPTRLNTPVNEDAIKTMVEAHTNGEALTIGKEEWENMEKKGGRNIVEGHSNKEELLIKLLQFTLRNHQEQPQGADNNNGNQINEIFNLIKKESNGDFLKQVLEGLNKPEDKPEGGQELTLQIVESRESVSAGESKEKSKRKEPKITVSGDKNTRLICITDDNSLIEPVEEVEDKSCQVDDNDGHKLKKTSSQTQTDVQSEKKTTKAAVPASTTQKSHKTKPKTKNCSHIKISRIKKCERNLKPLQPLDKRVAVDSIQYKLDFYRHCKTNPMYKTSTTCQPWTLMNKISEEIFNECLLTVAREIEVNEMVEKVYQSELQL